MKTRVPEGVGSLRKGLEWVFSQLGLISGVLAIVMMIIVMREVVGRYLFSSPSEWSVELCGYLLVAATFLASAYTQQVEGHVRIDLVYRLWKGKTKVIVDMVIYLIVIIYCTTITWQGWQFAYKSLVTDARSAEATGWPLFPSQVMIPIGSFFMAVAALLQLFKSARLLKGG